MFASYVASFQSCKGPRTWHARHVWFLQVGLERGQRLLVHRRAAPGHVDDHRPQARARLPDRQYRADRRGNLQVSALRCKVANMRVAIFSGERPGYCWHASASAEPCLTATCHVIHALSKALECTEMHEAQVSTATSPTITHSQQKSASLETCRDNGTGWSARA